MNKYIQNNENLIVSHIADIDGCAAVVLAKIYNPNMDVILADTGDLDSVIADLVKDDYCSKYKNIYITDLPIRLSGIELIDGSEALKSRLVHYDHHTSEVGNKFSFLNIIPEVDGQKACGTSLIYNYFKNQDPNNTILNSEYVKDFVEAVRCRDNWIKENPGFEIGGYLSDLFTFFGPEEWINRLVYKCLSTEETKVTFSQDERLILKSLKADMISYIDEADKRIRVTDYNGYKVGVLAAERFRSELGNILATRHPELDFIAIVDFTRKQISLRGVKDNLDLGTMAKTINPKAGGQKKAAGIPIENENIIESVFQEVFQNEKAKVL